MYSFNIAKIGQSNSRAFSRFIPPDLSERLKTDPDVCAVGASIYGLACGCAVFECAGSHAQILSLSVASDAAYTLCALDLLDEVVRAARAAGSIDTLGADFCCEDDEESDSLLAAYRAAGFVVYPSGMQQLWLDSNALAGSSGLSKPRPLGGVRCAEDFSSVDYYKLNAFLKASENAFIDTPVTPDNILPALTVVHEDGEGKPDGAVIFNNGTPDGCSLALMVFRDKRASAHAMALLQSALQRIERCYPGGAQIRVSAISPEAQKLVRKLAGGAIIRTQPAFTASIALCGPARDETNERIFSLITKGAQTNA